MKRYNALSLVELLLYIAISAVILISVTQLVGVIYQSQIKSKTIEEVNQQGAYLMQQITDNVRNSSTITTPTRGNASNTLVFNSYDVTKGTVTYSISANKLFVTEGGNPAVQLSSNKVNITNFTITNASQASTDGNVRIQITISHINPDNRNEFSYQKTYYGSASTR
jgi:hypothetical protein